ISTLFRTQAFADGVELNPERTSPENQISSKVHARFNATTPYTAAGTNVVAPECLNTEPEVTKCGPSANEEVLSSKFAGMSNLWSKNLDLQLFQLVERVSSSLDNMGGRYDNNDVATIKKPIGFTELVKTEDYWMLTKRSSTVARVSGSSPHSGIDIAHVSCVWSELRHSDSNYADMQPDKTVDTQMNVNVSSHQYNAVMDNLEIITLSQRVPIHTQIQPPGLHVVLIAEHTKDVIIMRTYSRKRGYVWCMDIDY
ncbi:hypothetical protein Tco_0548237, partial [Tanacetum coccineum]